MMIKMQRIQSAASLQAWAFQALKLNLRNGNNNLCYLETRWYLKKKNLNNVVTMTKQFLELILNSWLVIFLKRQLGFKRQHYSSMRCTLCFVLPSTLNQQLYFMHVFTERAGWDLVFSLGSMALLDIAELDWWNATPALRSLDFQLQVILDLKDVQSNSTQKSSTPEFPMQ